MNLLKKYFILISFLVILLSCECYPVRKGIIIDETTHMPIENAQVEFGNSKCLSDANGEFEISASGCDLKLIVTKFQYKPFGVKLKKNDAEIYIKIDDEIKDYDLEKPDYLRSDSNTFINIRSVSVNSVHFEYLDAAGNLKIYMEKKE